MSTSSMVMSEITPHESASNRYTIRRALDDDRGRVIALVSEMFREDVTPRYEWLYRGNPHGVALSWLAIERASGDAVGVTSLFPRRVVVGGRERVGSIGGDCYIAPRARRRGLATLLHRASLAEMHGLGVDFMYGPPRPNNLGALLKAGARDVTTFRRFTRPLTAEGAAESLLHALESRLGAPRASDAAGSADGTTRMTSRFSPSVQHVAARLARAPVRVLDRLFRADVGAHRIERMAELPAGFTELSARVAPLYPIACLRDAELLRWRYLDCRARTQLPYALREGDELVGLVVIELAAKAAVIVDVFVEPVPARIDAALQLAIDAARAAGSSHVDISITPGSPVAQRLPRLGFVGREGAVFQVAVRDDDPAAATLRAAESWHFTDGDKDSDTVFSIEPD